LGRKDRNIEKPADLKGKKVASPKGTTGEFGLSEFLRTNGLSMKDIEFVNLQTLSLPNAIVKGDIDAYAAWEMHVYNGQKGLGNNGIVFVVEKAAYREYQNVYGKKDWLSKNPEVIKGFLRALIKAEKYISENPAEALAITAKETGFSKEALNSVKDNYKIWVGLDIGHWVKLLEREGQWINSQKPEAERKTLPDYRKQLNSRFLKEVNSSRIK
jgi:NitT/TauT family transport system substrate-binding protein